MKASSTTHSKDKWTGWPAVELKGQEQDMKASRVPQGTGPGLAGQQFHKPQDQGRGAQQCTTQNRTSICWPAVEHSTGPGQVHASRAPHAKGPRHEGQQDNTSNRTSTRRPAGRHTTQDQVHGGQRGNTLHRTKHTNQQGTTQHRIGPAGEKYTTQNRTRICRRAGQHTS